ncbi:MAG: peptidoglycan-associated lipoprotein Pal, partial [Magnetococcales bacterium]|nr:peptidoglycan-associated lipoprotein Pal [Magnetococcales bacterium]
MKSLGSLIFSILLIGLVAGCSSNPKSTPASGDTAATSKDGSDINTDQNNSESGNAIGRSSSSSDDLDLDGATSGGTWATAHNERRVFFALNSSILDGDATALLRSNVSWLSNLNNDIIIEGHCDERGTREYNLALGQQRAEAVVRFLIAQGISHNRIQAISYGKERPLIRGHSNSAWAKNRRAEIVIKSY